MLHMIGMILKIIGIILAVILGILVLLICIALFVPLRYQIRARTKGTLESSSAELKFSWLFHLISGFAAYEDGELKWKLRLLFKKMGSGIEEQVPVKEEKPARKKDPEKKKENTEKQKSQTHRPSNMPEIGMQEKKTAEEEKLADRERLQPDQVNQERKTEQPKKKPEHLLGRLVEKIKAFWEKVKAFFANIKYTFQKLCDKIKVLIEKKEQILLFIEDEGHKSAFARMKKEVFRLLRFLKPRKFILQTKFGFEDPYRTGQVLAALAVIYPFTGGKLAVKPDFENRVLEGDLYVKGKVRGAYAAVIAWNLFWDKNVRTLYADIKRMRE